MNPLLTASASSLARRIRERQLTSRSVVDAHIDRIRATQATLNAMVCDRFQAAREEADAADRAVAAGAELGPLHGVPITIKECLALAGMPQSVGMVSRRDVRAERDAVVVARLRHAGAIPLGVSNIPELAMWMETANKVYGRTNNPYDPTRIVGGSSGGEGALVGAGASPIGIGSDIAGSIRMPAFFNGVFGHKPSAGLVPNTGHWPKGQNAAARYLTTGPLCRRAEDLWLTLSIIAGPDGEDAACQPCALRDPAQVSFSGLTVYDVPTSGRFHIDPELVRAQRRAADHLAGLGARVIPYSNAALGRAFEIWSAAMSATTTTTKFSDLLGGTERLSLASALSHLVRRDSPHTLPALALVLLEAFADRIPGVAEALAAADLLKRELDLLLDDKALLLYPSYPDQAPKHDEPLLSPFKWQYTAIWNVMEVPVTQIPLGLSGRGLPLGIQAIAGHGRDHLSMAAAVELERAFGGWVPPPALSGY